MEKIGRYTVLAEIGRGGMGVVYRAQDTVLNREVALKLLPAQLSSDETFVRRFQREAQAVARLEHAHIVPVYDVGEYEGRPFLVMRLLRGGSLRDRLQNRSLTQTTLWEVLTQIALALDAVHAHGVVHRDIKPANILFDEQGTAFVSDFGIARLSDVTTQLTGSGLIGSPIYMSPEQFKAQQIDGQSDQYNLAVMVYEALAGTPPFTGDTVQVMYHHLETPPPSLHTRNSGISPALSSVLDRALAKQPQARYKTVTAFVQALRVAGSAVSTRQDSQTASAPDLPPPQTPPPAVPREDRGSTTRAKQLQKSYAQGLAAWDRADWAAATAAFARVLELEPHHPKARSRYEEAQRNLSQSGHSSPNRLPSQKAQLGGRKSDPSSGVGVKEPKVAAARGIIAGAGGTTSRTPWKLSLFRRWPWWAWLVGFLLVGGGLTTWAILSRRTIVQTTIVEILVTATWTPSVEVATAPLTTPLTIEVVQSVNGVRRLTFQPGETPSVGGEAELMELLLPDGSRLFLAAESEAQIRRVAGPGDAEATEVQLDSGQLVVQAAGPMVVQNPPGAKIELEGGGLIGVTYRQQPFSFAAACLAGTCQLFGDLGGEMALAAGQGAEVGGNGQPTAAEPADYGAYIFAPVVPTPTATPIPTATATPTMTPTRTPTPFPSRTPMVTSQVILHTATPVAADRDGDGIPDTQDECPNERGSWAENGCPAPPPTSPPTPILPTAIPDSDGDGYPDSQDNCPSQPYPINGGCAP